jgi:hypothetical protein
MVPLPLGQICCPNLMILCDISVEHGPEQVQQFNFPKDGNQRKFSTSDYKIMITEYDETENSNLGAEEEAINEPGNATVNVEASVDEGSEGPPQETRRRWRKLKPSEWKVNHNKALRQAGLPYK